ncbi:DUF6669 family protein [Clostridium boliviensis]|uniref:DUF6669 family protein n=1 Tax=Clostridium boliviensis TaxID=318465 RepID=A0ABU4GND8_9CLOT|nr:DUF6669 family protein [Clostridium boliviensis]MDW2799126.1 DUF6669 family protein [Clostridium boliviensis]
MELIYETGGVLNEGFVGQISYTICLDRVYDAMDIEFTFDKQRYNEITKEMTEKIRKSCSGLPEYEHASDEEIMDVMRGMKTEIHTIVTMNDTFIGGVHKQLITRNMVFTKDFTSDGCIPQDCISGVIKVTLAVFNVLLDGTNYRLTLSAGNQEKQVITDGGAYV